MDFLNDSYEQYDLIYKSDLLFQESGEHYTPLKENAIMILKNLF